MEWETLGSMLAMFGTFSGIMLWMMARMENRLHTDINNLIASCDAKWMAMNIRIDTHNAAVNQRLDANQAIIMRMLEKQGK